MRERAIEKRARGIREKVQRKLTGLAVELRFDEPERPRLRLQFSQNAQVVTVEFAHQTQSKAPYDIDGNPVTTVRFGHDLIELAAAAHPTAPGARSFFCFRGFALADLALAHLVVARARERGIGIELPR